MILSRGQGIAICAFAVEFLQDNFLAHDGNWIDAALSGLRMLLPFRSIYGVARISLLRIFACVRFAQPIFSGGRPIGAASTPFQAISRLFNSCSARWTGGFLRTAACATNIDASVIAALVNVESIERTMLIAFRASFFAVSPSRNKPAVRDSYILGAMTHA